jgi:hypothetical protein
MGIGPSKPKLPKLHRKKGKKGKGKAKGKAKGKGKGKGKGKAMAKPAATPAATPKSTFTEERVMSGYYNSPPGTMMTDTFIVPGTYMTEKYTSGLSGGQMAPADVPMGMPASNTKKTADKAPTANKEPYDESYEEPYDESYEESYEDWPGTLTPGEFPGIYDSPATQQGGGPDAGGMRMRKISHFTNNQPSLPGINLSDAMPLSPMVESKSVEHPTKFAMMLLLILFAVFIAMRK